MIDAIAQPFNSHAPYLLLSCGDQIVMVDERVSCAPITQWWQPHRSHALDVVAPASGVAASPHHLLLGYSRDSRQLCVHCAPKAPAAPIETRRSHKIKSYFALALDYRCGYEVGPRLDTSSRTLRELASAEPARCRPLGSAPVAAQLTAVATADPSVPIAGAAAVYSELSARGGHGRWAVDAGAGAGAGTGAGAHADADADVGENPDAEGASEGPGNARACLELVQLTAMGDLLWSCVPMPPSAEAPGPHALSDRHSDSLPCGVRYALQAEKHAIDSAHGNKTLPAPQQVPPPSSALRRPRGTSDIKPFKRLRTDDVLNLIGGSARGGDDEEGGDTHSPSNESENDHAMQLVAARRETIEAAIRARPRSIQDLRELLDDAALGAPALTAAIDRVFGDLVVIQQDPIPTGAPTPKGRLPGVLVRLAGSEQPGSSSPGDAQEEEERRVFVASGQLPDPRDELPRTAPASATNQGPQLGEFSHDDIDFLVKDAERWFGEEKGSPDT